MPDTTPPALLSLRAAVILALAVLIASATGLFTYTAEPNLAKAALAGGTAFGAAVGLLNVIVART